MYDIYGIVKVEYSSYNEGEYFVSISHVINLILPKCAKTQRQALCIMVHSRIIKYIHDIIHLDNSK